MIKIGYKDLLFNKTSTGSQDKWHIRDKWYKIDDFNYEGLSETLASDILKKSNVEKYAIYNPEKIIYKGKEFSGCESPHFLKKDERLVECMPLLEKHGISILGLTIENFVNQIEEITHLSHFDQYLAKMMEFDQLILNSDRHYYNMAVIKNKTGYDYAPFFDQGRGFALKDDYWKDEASPEEVIEKIEPRLYIGNFARQTAEIERIAGGKFLEISYTKDDLQDTLSRCAPFYPDPILSRAEKVFLLQMERNMDYFVGKEKENFYKDILFALKERGLNFASEIRNNTISIINENFPTLSFHINSDKSIIPYENGSPMEEDRLILHFSNAYNFYRQMFYALNPDRERIINNEELDR